MLRLIERIFKLLILERFLHYWNVLLNFRNLEILFMLLWLCQRIFHQHINNNKIALLTNVFNNVCEFKWENCRKENDNKRSRWQLWSKTFSLSHDGQTFAEVNQFTSWHKPQAINFESHKFLAQVKSSFCLDFRLRSTSSSSKACFRKCFRR